jgi:antirestriction protein
MVNPLTKKLFDTIDKYTAAYVMGECSYEDALDLAFGEVNEYAGSEEFHKEMENYFDEFVNIKKIGKEEINFD